MRCGVIRPPCERSLSASSFSLLSITLCAILLEPYNSNDFANDIVLQQEHDVKGWRG